ncbi:hypothetical protein BDN72DRAFT_750828, partial [Pluteus cervinus]
LVKPPPPEEYDGAANQQAFVKFLTDANIWLNVGRVPEDQKVLMLSRYLKKKAHTFYMQEVAIKPSKWKLKDFFVELFNYCFPVTFRSTQREKMENCRQGGRTVRDFVSELTFFFVTVGQVSKHEKVRRLWDGLRSDIRSRFWAYGNRLSKETSSWDEV